MDLLSQGVDLGNNVAVVDEGVGLCLYPHLLNLWAGVGHVPYRDPDVNGTAPMIFFEEGYAGELGEAGLKGEAVDRNGGAHGVGRVAGDP